MTVLVAENASTILGILRLYPRAPPLEVLISIHNPKLLRALKITTTHHHTRTHGRGTGHTEPTLTRTPTCQSTTTKSPTCLRVSEARTLVAGEPGEVVSPESRQSGSSPLAHCSNRFTLTRAFVGDQALDQTAVMTDLLLKLLSSRPLKLSYDPSSSCSRRWDQNQTWFPGGIWSADTVSDPHRHGGSHSHGEADIVWQWPLARILRPQLTNGRE